LKQAGKKASRQADKPASCLVAGRRFVFEGAAVGFVCGLMEQPFWFWIAFTQNV